MASPPAQSRHPAFGQSKFPKPSPAPLGLLAKAKARAPPTAEKSCEFVSSIADHRYFGCEGIVGAAGFLTLAHCLDRLERYLEPSRFDRQCGARPRKIGVE